MNLEKQTINKQEGCPQKIDLSGVNFEFIGDKEIREYFKRKLSDDFEAWFEDKKDKFEKSKESIAEFVKNGIIPDGKPETIYAYEKNQILKTSEDIFLSKEKIKNNLETIIDEVRKKLEKYIDNWKPKDLKVKVTIDESTNFRYDKDVVYVDLVRLAQDKNEIEEIIEGITHELVHAWFEESENEKDIQEKTKMVRRIFDEGIAVFVSGQSLRKHHEKNIGRDYDEYKKYSLEKYKEFLADDCCDVKKKYEKGFKNMGYFYVAGFEMVKKIYNEKGDEGVKEFMIESKEKNILDILNEHI